VTATNAEKRIAEASLKWPVMLQTALLTSVLTATVQRGDARRGKRPVKIFLDMSYTIYYYDTVIIDYQKACDFGRGQTLLSAFLLDRIMSYEEPVRRGTPKGDKIGFPRSKHAAALFVGVTGLNQRQTAERLGLSHRLLLKWHTESDYRDALQRHCKDFVEALAGHLASDLPERYMAESYARLTDDAEFYGEGVFDGLNAQWERLYPRTLADAGRFIRFLAYLMPVKHGPARMFFADAARALTNYLETPGLISDSIAGMLRGALLKLVVQAL